MSIFEILSAEFLAELSDDPREAFSMIVGRATEYLSERLKQVDDNERSSWHEYENAQHTVMNVIIASAKRLNVEPFASMEVPQRDNFGSRDFVQFQSDLDHFVTQLVLDNSIRTRREAVVMSPKIKGRIRSLLHAIRQQIDAAAMPEARRAALHAKLAQFEAELEKKRVPVFMAARIILEVLSISANVLALSDSATFHKLIGNVMQAVAEAKAADDENRQLPSSEPPRAILPPRKNFDPRPSGPRESFPADLDDEIPF